MIDVFVFGSNLAGRHGAGAAKFAKENWGAEYGCGEGRTGSSYAIPTKDWHIKTMTLSDIAFGVDRFIEYAKQNPKTIFGLTKIGCGLAGYDWHNDIRPMFPDKLPDNVIEI